MECAEDEYGEKEQGEGEVCGEVCEVVWFGLVWFGWDVVLLSEVWAESSGATWMGDDEERVVVVYSEKVGVMLRGQVLRVWCEGGMIKKVSERHVSVKLKEWY